MALRGDREGASEGRRLGAVAGLVVAGLAAAPAPASAEDAPVLTVRGRAAVDVDPVRRTGEGVTISGVVIDRSTGEPIPDGLVRVRFGAESERMLAGDDGRFEAALADPGGPRDLRVEFAGTDHYPPAEHTLARIDPRERPLELSLDLPDVADLADEGLDVKLTARSEGRAPAISASILAGRSSGELARIADVTTRWGRAEVSIPIEALGPPGRAIVAAAAPGGEGFDAARTEAGILVRADTELALSVGAAELDFDDALAARGRLVDIRGEPVAGAPLRLEAGGRELARATTDGDGAFAASIPAAELGEGELSLSARFEPHVPYFAASRSDAIALSVGSPRSIPVAYTLAAFGAAGALALALSLGRALFAIRPRRRPVPEAGQGGDGARTAGAAGGLTVARRPLGAALRRPADCAVDGVVRDAKSEAPVAGARVALAGPDEIELEAGDDGRFAVELSPGSWEITVASAGYVSERFGLSVPHRGELRGVVVKLVSVREQIFARYRDVAQALLPSFELWGVWTPRRIVDHVRKTRPAAALAALTDRVEESYFSARIPVESELAAIDELVAATRAERGD